MFATLNKYTDDQYIHTYSYIQVYLNYKVSFYILNTFIPIFLYISEIHIFFYHIKYSLPSASLFRDVQFFLEIIIKIVIFEIREPVCYSSCIKFSKLDPPGGKKEETFSCARETGSITYAMLFFLVEAEIHFNMPGTCIEQNFVFYHGRSPI